VQNSLQNDVLDFLKFHQKRHISFPQISSKTTFFVKSGASENILAENTSSAKKQFFLCSAWSAGKLFKKYSNTREFSKFHQKWQIEGMGNSIENDQSEKWEKFPQKRPVDLTNKYSLPKKKEIFCKSKLAH